MVTDLNFRHDQADQGVAVQMAYYNGVMPYEDPAIVNPNELASFPKHVKREGHHHHESHLYHRTPVTDGRYITRTDNQPGRYGL